MWRATELGKAQLDPLQESERHQQIMDQYSMRAADEYRFANAATHSVDQVKQRLAHFWLNHFTVGAKEG